MGNGYKHQWQHRLHPVHTVPGRPKRRRTRITQPPVLPLPVPVPVFPPPPDAA